MSTPPCSAPFAQHLVAQLAIDAAGVIDLAEHARHELHARGAQISQLLVFLERRLVVAAGRLDLVGEADRVFHRGVAALRQILKHRMRGVAEQRDAALGPVLDRRAVAQHPHLPGVDLLQQRAHRLALVLEALVQLGRIAVGVPALLVAVGVEHHDEVEQLAAAERVVHQVGLLAAPADHLGQAVLRGPFRGRQHRAIGDVAGHDRLAVADDLLAHRGPQSVAADQRRALVGLAGLGLHGDARSGVVDRHHLLRDRELDQVRFLAGVEDDVEHVGAVNDAVGRAVFVVEALVDLHVDDGFGGDRVAKLQAFGKRAPVEHLLGQSEHLEHPEHVGSELDAGADLLELGRLFQHLHRDALARQRQRRRQSADAAADNQDGGLIGARTHTVTPGHSDTAAF